MGRPVQGHFQRPTLAGVDRAAVHGIAGLFRSAAGLSVSLGCGYWGRPSVENSVSSCGSDNCARQLSDLLAGQRPAGAAYLRNTCPFETLIPIECGAIVAEMLCQNGERQLRRPASAPRVMCGWPPACKGFFACLCIKVTCGHVSGLLARRKTAGPDGFRGSRPDQARGVALPHDP